MPKGSELHITDVQVYRCELTLTFYIIVSTCYWIQWNYIVSKVGPRSMSTQTGNFRLISLRSSVWDRCERRLPISDCSVWDRWSEIDAGTPPPRDRGAKKAIFQGLDCQEVDISRFGLPQSWNFKVWGTGPPKTRYFKGWSAKKLKI